MVERGMTTEISERFHVLAYGRIVVIERDDAEFELPFLPVTWQHAPLDAVPDRRYTVKRSSEQVWSIATDNGEPTVYPKSVAIADHIEGDLHHWLATYTKDYLFVHAGCVGWRDRAIVIPGRSFAGKTTLTQALLEAGATYYSDDYAIIDASGAVHPFPRMLRVRPIPPGPSQRVDPRSSNWPIGQKPIRAGVVAALTYDADAGWDVEPLIRGMGALSLLDNTVAARERPEDALKLMSIAMTDALAIKGTRDDAASSARRLIAMVDELIDGDADRSS
jgi:hypothetical protein